MAGDGKKSVDPMEDGGFQRRRETLDFLAPVGQQRRRHHNQRFELLQLPGFLEVQQCRDHLQGLAQTHIIGEQRAKAESGILGQPLEAALLIGPKIGYQPARPRRRRIRPQQLIEQALGIVT